LRSVSCCRPAQIKSCLPEDVASRGIEEIPCRVVINPQMSVTNNAGIIDRESCCSLNGMSGLVQRAKAIKVRVGWGLFLGRLV
jgi:peptide deformylase